MLKRILSLALTLALVLSIAPVTFAANGSLDIIHNAYIQVIKEFSQNIKIVNESKGGNGDLIFMYWYFTGNPNDNANGGYAQIDIDGNGVNELVLSFRGINKIYSVVNEKAIELDWYAPRAYCYGISFDGIIYSYQHGGYADFQYYAKRISADGTKLETVYWIESTTYRSGEVGSFPRYYKHIGNIETKITEAEFNLEVANIDKQRKLELNFIPITLTVDAVDKAPSNITVTIPLRNNHSTTIQWGEGLFNKSSYNYSDEIALAAAVLSEAAYVEDKNENSGYYIENAYRLLGFAEENISLYSYKGHPKNRSHLKDMNDDTLSFSIAHQPTSDGNLLVVVLRGTKGIPLSGDFLKDLQATTTANALGVNVHKGFNEFQQDVIRGLNDYRENHTEIQKGRLKILVTGHSLGGAGANLVGAWFNDPATKWAQSNDDIYTYTFASPNTYYGSNSTVGSCANIWNIVNIKDPVPKLPHRTGFTEFFNIGHSWRKFGITKQFEISSLLGLAESFDVLHSENDLYYYTNKYHWGHLYIKAVESGEIGKNTSSNITYIVACPVDVEIYDSNDILVGKIINNVVDLTIDADVMLYVQDDTKFIWLPDDSGYYFKLTGTDDGYMQFIVEKQNSETGEPIVERAFSNVELYAGKQMATSVSNDTSDIKLFVVNSGGNVTSEIQPDKPTYTFDPIPAGDQTATATNAKVLVDGRNVTFDAYTINQQTYYQIADIALQVAGTPKRFAAVWDGGRGAINLTSGSAHSGVMAAKGSGSKTATVTKAKIYLDGAEIPLTAYTINSHTYYRLKDVAQVFDFGVGWDGASSTITIDTASAFAL